MHQSSPKLFDSISRGVRCPHCSNRAHRIPRRPIDRILSLFTSARRYWCYECDWQGNLSDEDALPFSSEVLRRATAVRAFELKAIEPKAVELRPVAQPVAAPAAANDTPQRRALAVAGRGFGT